MRRWLRALGGARAAVAGWPDRTALDAFRQRRLRRVLWHAYTRVPYQRERFDRHGLHPDDIDALDDLRRIPPSTRREIQRRPPGDLVATGFDPDRLIAVRTSGSSGAPLTVRKTWLEQNLLHLFRLRAEREHGVRPRDRAATVTYVRSADSRDNKLLGRTLDAFGLFRNVLVDALLPPAEVLARLMELRPDVIGGYPGVLSRVAGLVGEKERRQLGTRLVRPESEVLAPHMRRRIEAGFGAPVLDSYASYEFNVIAVECPSTGAMHVVDDSVIVEILRNGEPVAPGERGEVVITGLHTFTMPFIRYRQGDIAVRGSDRCACGAPYSTLSAVGGRMIDSFRLPDGGTLHPYEIMQHLVGEDVHAIEQYRVVQEGLDRIVLEVVPGSGMEPEDLDRWSRVARAVVGTAIDIEVRPVDEIAVTGTGKIRVAQSFAGSGGPPPEAARSSEVPTADGAEEDE